MHFEHKIVFRIQLIIIMNTNVLLWILLGVLVLLLARTIAISILDFRIWLITSKFGYWQYRVKLFFIQVKSEFRLRRKLLGILVHYRLHLVRMWWYKIRIHSGFKAERPMYSPKSMASEVPEQTVSDEK